MWHKAYLQPAATRRVQALAAIVWPQTYADILSRQQIDYMMDSMYSTAALEKDVAGGVCFFTYIVDGSDAGYAAIQPMGNAVFKLHKIYLLPSFQGLGHGKNLLELISRAIIERGGNIVELNVNRHNKALEFYKKRGFEIIGKEDIDIGNGYFMNDYVMRKCVV